MSKFLWLSTASEDTGNALASALGIPAGRVPPKGFEGLIINWGSIPAENFQWDKRTIKAIMNDPRVIRKYLSKSVMAARLVNQAVPSIVFGSRSSFPTSTPYIAMTPNGQEARKVQTADEKSLAVEQGLTVAADVRYFSPSRIRVFVCNGKVVGALQAKPSSEAFLDAAAAAVMSEADLHQTDADDVKAALAVLLQKELISPVQEHAAFSSFTTTGREEMVALEAAKALGADFCAVDISDSGAAVVFNVLFSPNLVDYPSIKESVVKEMTSYIQANTQTAKERLLSLWNSANEEEAEEMLSYLMTGMEVKEEAKKYRAA